MSSQQTQQSSQSGNTPRRRGYQKNKIELTYCRFKKYRIKYVDYKDPEFLKRFVNPQGKILPRRLTGTSLKFQRRVSTAIKNARQMALLPFVTDDLK